MLEKKKKKEKGKEKI